MMYRRVAEYAILFVSMIAAALVVTTLYARERAYDVVGVPATLKPQLPVEDMSSDHNIDAKLKHAELLWQRSVEDRRSMVEEVGRSRAFPDGYIYPYNVWDFARPSFYCPLDLERVGTIGDGGKIVCGMTKYDSHSSSTNSGLEPDGNDTADGNNQLVVYSFGVSGDSTFEAALLSRTNAQIWGYDYSVDSWADQIHDEWLPRARFNRIGISGQTNLEAQPPMSTIQDLMKANGHTYIDIMKMDIEGAEFDALSSLAEFTKEQAKLNNEATPLLPIGQLLLEIHFMKPPKGFSIPSDLTSWLEWWSSLEKLGLRAVNNEDNWIGDVRFGKPRFMEYTMINALDQRNRLFA